MGYVGLLFWPILYNTIYHLGIKESLIRFSIIPIIGGNPMNCEMCGKQTKRLIQTEIESTTMSVCQDCSQFGKNISTFSQDKEVSSYRAPTQVEKGLEKRKRRQNEQEKSQMIACTQIQQLSADNSSLRSVACSSTTHAHCFLVCSLSSSSLQA